jgi:transcriptional regulator with XRE-family HTH domain
MGLRGGEGPDAVPYTRMDYEEFLRQRFPRRVNEHKRWPSIWTERRDWAEVVGSRVRRLRAARDLTLWQLSQTVRRSDGLLYSPTTFSRLERGSAASPFYVYLQVAESLEIEPGRLLGPDSALLDATEGEATLLETLRELRIAPHEALAQLVQARSTAMRSSSPSM